MPLLQDAYERLLRAAAAAGMQHVARALSDLRSSSLGMGELADEQGEMRSQGRFVYALPVLLLLPLGGKKNKWGWADRPPVCAMRSRCHARWSRSPLPQKSNSPIFFKG